MQNTLKQNVTKTRFRHETTEQFRPTDGVQHCYATGGPRLCSRRSAHSSQVSLTSHFPFSLKNCSQTDRLIIWQTRILGLFEMRHSAKSTRFNITLYSNGTTVQSPWHVACCLLTRVVARVRLHSLWRRQGTLTGHNKMKKKEFHREFIILCPIHACLCLIMERKELHSSAAMQLETVVSSCNAIHHCGQPAAETGYFDRLHVCDLCL
jgi:hypothetical protein